MSEYVLVIAGKQRINPTGVLAPFCHHVQRMVTLNIVIKSNYLHWKHEALKVLRSYLWISRFVEIMAPVFSREAWRCVWHMIQVFFWRPTSMNLIKNAISFSFRWQWTYSSSEMSQNDLVHGWGLDLALQRCLEVWTITAMLYTSWNRKWKFVCMKISNSDSVGATWKDRCSWCTMD